jgi:hypothetical protein
MCETIEKITLLSVYFFIILWIKKYFKGTLFSLKMQYLNKQGQQASLKHPDEVITRWRSYTIWRVFKKCVYKNQAALKVHKHEIFFFTFLAETETIWSQGPVTRDFF